MLIGGFQKFSMIDYPEKLSAIVFTQGCNLKCPYCHNPELNNLEYNSNQISEDYILNFLKTRQRKLDAVVITGGEPTLQNDLISFAKKIKDLGFLLKLDTNGTQPNVIKKMLKENLLDYIAMDIKTAPKKYFMFSKNHFDLANITSSINLIINSKIDYEFRTTVIKNLLTVDDFNEMGLMLNGANKYYLQKFVPTKILDKSFITSQSYSNEEFEKIKEILTKHIKNIELR